MMGKWIFILCVAFSASLCAEVKVLALAGSTREGSFNKKLVSEAAGIARQMGACVTLIDLKDYPIPFYDGDLEASLGMPQKAKELRKLMIQSQVILIASPEYNASVSAVLKNFIDWVSRSEQGGSSRDLEGKKFVIMSTSPGRGGGARGLVHLRAILEDIGGTVVPQQVVVPDAYNAFDEWGHLKSPKLKAEIRQALQSVI
jgi:NAD(P)H-dependent FMN reductase